MYNIINLKPASSMNPNITEAGNITLCVNLRPPNIWPRPQATPSFSMLHAEKQEGLVRKYTCVTPLPRNATYVQKGHFALLRSCPFQATDLKRDVCTLFAN